MTPFDGPGNGASGLQIAYDERRLRYLECLAKRAFMMSDAFSDWNNAERRRAPVIAEPGAAPQSPYDARHASLCDAVRDLGLDRLDPGLAVVQDRLDKMPETRRNALQRRWLMVDDQREAALARALMVRADPQRQDELFGWERAGVSPDEYWARFVPPIHMTYLLETADFSANEVMRILYQLDETPQHLQEAAMLWRDPEQLQRDPNFTAGASAALHTAFTNFKFWLDDPFRCSDFDGPAKALRESKDTAITPETMDRGQDMTYWSENHRILFASAEYLAGQFWPDELFVSQRSQRKEGPHGPPRPGDKTGRQHMAHARVRVLRWLNERLRLGFAEWNSPVYYVEDVLPVMNLVDFAVDPEVRTRAAMVMDLLVFDLAVHSQSGAFAGSAGRCYFEGKNCVWGQSIRDSSELLFGQTGHFVQSSNAAVFLATSPAYRPPDALIALAINAPQRFTTRSRVSIDFDEAASYGIGTRTLDDMEFWWSRGGYAAKQTILASRQIAGEYGLLDTRPFSKILPMIEKVAGAIDTAEDVGGILLGIGGAVAGFALGGPIGAVAGGVAGAVAGASVPDFDVVSAADLFSVLTEGSLLTRANLYSHRCGGATLASVQNFRRGQVNFQGLPCIAALDGGAMVWTSYPSAGSHATIRLPLGAYKIDQKLFGANEHDGPNWWTGNVVQPRVAQQRTAAITMYQAPTLQETLFGERTHAWFPKRQFDETRGPESARCNHDSARWFFGRSRDSYVALFCALETDWTSDGAWKDTEIRVEGDTNVFITQIGSAQEFGSFETFVAKVGQARVHITGLHSPAQLRCSYEVPLGERLDLAYDDGAFYGGEALQEDGFPRHRSPFARIAWQQDRYAIRAGARSLVHDVVQGTRTVGGELTELDHATPLAFYAQNMALLPGLLYKGIDSDGALGRLIALLRERQPDVVGLSEMWTSDDRDRVTSELADLYPFSSNGPHEDLADIGPVEVMGGGLLLLSRHPIVARAQSLYRQCSGDDCLANKGVLHARVEPRGHPCTVDVFLTHTQAAHPTIGGSTAGAREAVRAQVRHLADFIRASRDITSPALLLGDLNIDFFAHREIYDELVAALGNPVDLRPAVALEGVARPTGTSESDDGNISSFHHKNPPRDAADKARFGSTVERLDYLFCLPGLLYSHHPAPAEVWVEQWSDGRDMSDHYGLHARIDSTREVFPAEIEIPAVTIALRGMRCLQTTSGFGDDEVMFTLTAKGVGGASASLTTPAVEDVSAGTWHGFDLAPLLLADPGDELALTVSGRELDNLSANDSLGGSRLVLDRSTLQALLLGPPRWLALPVLRGDGGEYVVVVEVGLR